MYTVGGAGNAYHSTAFLYDNVLPSNFDWSVYHTYRVVKEGAKITAYIDNYVFDLGNSMQTTVSTCPDKMKFGSWPARPGNGLDGATVKNVQFMYSAKYPLDTIPDLKFYLKVEDYTSGNAWVDRVSNIEVHVPGSASFHEGYVHLSGTAITAPLQTNPNVMQSATYVIRLRVPTIPSNLGWVMSQFPDFGWSRALTISDYRLGHVGQTPGHFQPGLGSFPTDTWQVLVGTWTQGGACQTFLQGTSGNPRTCSNGAGTDSNEKLIIGGRGETDAGHNPDSIDISDVLVFNRILNTDEITFITSTLSEPKLQWERLYTNVHTTCDENLIDTIYEADTEVLCKSACVANTECSAVFHITDSATSNRCLLYTKCDETRPTTYSGDTYRLTDVLTMTATFNPTFSPTLNPTANPSDYPTSEMTHLGVGYCTSGFYAGWDGQGIDSQEACNQVCLTEQQCTYAAFFAGKTCSRYNGNACTLNSDTNHITYAKQSNSDVEMT